MTELISKSKLILVIDRNLDVIDLVCRSRSEVENAIQYQILGELDYKLSVSDETKIPEDIKSKCYRASLEQRLKFRPSQYSSGNIKEIGAAVGLNIPVYFTQEIDCHCDPEILDEYVYVITIQRSDNVKEYFGAYDTEENALHAMNELSETDKQLASISYEDLFTNDSLQDMIDSELLHYPATQTVISKRKTIDNHDSNPPSPKKLR
jgi:hypothetical protein